MKKLSKEEQMQKNGGKKIWHCHRCEADFTVFFGSTRDKARKHIQDEGHTGYAIWGDGYLADCPNY